MFLQYYYIFFSKWKKKIDSPFIQHQTCLLWPVATGCHFSTVCSSTHGYPFQFYSRKYCLWLHRRVCGVKTLHHSTDLNLCKCTPCSLIRDVSWKHQLHSDRFVLMYFIHDPNEGTRWDSIGPSWPPPPDFPVVWFLFCITVPHSATEKDHILLRRCKQKSMVRGNGSHLSPSSLWWQ